MNFRFLIRAMKTLPKIMYKKAAGRNIGWVALENHKPWAYRKGNDDLSLDKKPQKPTKSHNLQRS